MRRWAIISLLLLLGGCGEQHPFGLDAEQMAPLPIYWTWWENVRQCTDVSADLDRVSWYLVDQIPAQADDWQPRGMWAAPHRIYLQHGHETDAKLVRHEMTHEQVQRADHAHICFRSF